MARYSGRRHEVCRTETEANATCGEMYLVIADAIE